MTERRLERLRTGDPWSLLQRSSAAPAEPAADELWRRTRLRPLQSGESDLLKAWFYLPEQLPPGAPLVVVLHGCRQTAAGFDRGSGWSRMADRLGFAVLLPEQTVQNNPRRCFRWYDAAQTRRGSGEVAAIAAATEQMVTEHRLARDRVHVVGLSAGGAMANALLACYPDRFVSGSIIAGLPHGAARGLDEAFQAMRRPNRLPGRARGEAVRVASLHPGPFPSITIWHGDADQTVDVENSEETLRQWLDVHGLDETDPTVETRQGRLHRRTWFGPDGRPMVEHNRISGMDHGVPIDPQGGPAAVGEGGPFLLDVGICSTAATLRFWGLANRPMAPGRNVGAASPGVPPAGASLKGGSLEGGSLKDGSLEGAHLNGALVKDPLLKDGGPPDAWAVPAIATALAARPSLWRRLRGWLGR